MALTGKLVSQINIKSDGVMFYELFKDTPYQIPGISPDNVVACDLLHGQWGMLGSVVHWTYTRDGKKFVDKHIIEVADVEKKLVTYKMIDGDLTALYKSFKTSLHVDTNGDDNIVTWTLEYEKLSEDVPDPHAIMELGHDMTKDIETYHLSKYITN